MINMDLLGYVVTRLPDIQYKQCKNQPTNNKCHHNVRIRSYRLEEDLSHMRNTGLYAIIIPVTNEFF